MDNYGEMAGLERRELERLIDSGLSKGFPSNSVIMAFAYAWERHTGSRKYFRQRKRLKYWKYPKANFFLKCRR